MKCDHIKLGINRGELPSCHLDELSDYYTKVSRVHLGETKRYFIPG